MKIFFEKLPPTPWGEILICKTFLILRVMYVHKNALIWNNVISRRKNSNVRKKSFFLIYCFPIFRNIFAKLGAGWKWHIKIIHKNTNIWILLMIIKNGRPMPNLHSRCHTCAQKKCSLKSVFFEKNVEDILYNWRRGQFATLGAPIAH